MRKHIFRLCGLLLLASIMGCASIAGNDQIIAIDSNPRGMEVGSTKNQIAPRKTPFFVKIPRSSSLELSLAATPAASPQKFARFCSWRYLESGVSSLVFFPFPALIPLSLGLDFFSGAAFQCPSPVRLGQDGGDAPLDIDAPCLRQIVYPPYSLGSEANAKVMAHWKEKVRAEAPFVCANEFYPEEIISLLNSFNINLNKPLNFALLSRDLLQEIGYQTGADRIVYFSPQPPKLGSLDLDVVAIDLYSAQETQRKRFLTIDQDSTKKPFGIKKIFHYGLINFPNSVTYGYQPRGLAVHAQGPYQISESDRQNSLIYLLANFSLTNVSHQRGFSPFSFDWNLFPGLQMKFDNKKYTLQHSSDSEPLVIGVNNYFVLTPLSFQGLLYLPLGVLIGKYGVGPLLVIQKSEEGKRYHASLRLGQTAGLGYRFFFGGDFFGFFEYERFYFPVIGATEDQSILKYQREQELVTLGVGYYLGQNTWHDFLSR
jgi:hypothetical protein